MKQELVGLPAGYAIPITVPPGTGSITRNTVLDIVFDFQM